MFGPSCFVFKAVTYDDGPKMKRDTWVKVVFFLRVESNVGMIQYYIFADKVDGWVGSKKAKIMRTWYSDDNFTFSNVIICVLSF